MNLSRQAKLVAGITILTVPTIMYGGFTLLGILTQGTAWPTPGGLQLNETQWALWRAGHAHAGVWVLLSLVLQVFIDGATLRNDLEWTARLSAPLAAVAVSGGFFGLAFFDAFRWLVYLGAAMLVLSLVLTGVGLLIQRGGGRGG